MIVLYPNSYCWNGYGLVDPDTLLTKEGLYQQTILRMVCKVTSNSEYNPCDLQIPLGASLLQVSLPVLALLLTLQF